MKTVRYQDLRDCEVEDSHVVIMGVSHNNACRRVRAKLNYPKSSLVESCDCGALDDEIVKLRTDLTTLGIEHAEAMTAKVADHAATVVRLAVAGGQTPEQLKRWQEIIEETMTDEARAERDAEAVKSKTVDVTIGYGPDIAHKIISETVTDLPAVDTKTVTLTFGDANTADVEPKTENRICCAVAPITIAVGVKWTNTSTKEIEGVPAGRSALRGPNGTWELLWDLPKPMTEAEFAAIANVVHNSPAAAERAVKVYGDAILSAAAADPAGDIIIDTKHGIDLPDCYVPAPRKSPPHIRTALVEKTIDNMEFVLNGPHAIAVTVRDVIKSNRDDLAAYLAKRKAFELELSKHAAANKPRRVGR